MSTPWWTEWWIVCLALAALLTVLGGIGSWKRHRQLRSRPRPVWDVPRGLSALDVADVYYLHHPRERSMYRAAWEYRKMERIFVIAGTR